MIQVARPQLATGTGLYLFFSGLLQPLQSVGATRVERATSWSQTKRSTRLSYAPNEVLKLETSEDVSEYN